MYAAEQAVEHPDEPALIMAPSGRVVTWAEYEAGANRVAHFLRDAGLRKGEHMAIFMENDPAVLLTEAGAERTGLYFTPVNSYLSAEEVAYIVNDSHSRVVVTSAAKAEVAEQLPALCPNVERWVMVGRGDPAGPFESWDEAVGHAETDHVSDEQMGAPMMYSSGTTGRPKGILRPMYDLHPSETSIAVAGIAALWSLREGMVYLSPAPMYHTAPQVSCAIALRMKSTVVVMEHFDPALYLDLVGRYRVTHSQVVPTMFIRMLKLPEEVRQAADISSLEIIIHAAAPCPVPVKEQMIEWFGPILIEYYAATEGNGATFIASQDWLAHKGSVGRAVLSEITILDEDGTPCPIGTPGTVWFGGATDFEYFNDPAQTASTAARRRQDEHGRRRRLSGRRGLPLPDGSQGEHDHLGRRQHLSAGDGEPPRHAPVRARRRGDRGAQRGPGRGGQGGRATDRGRGERRPAGTDIDRLLPRAPGALQVPADR